MERLGWKETIRGAMPFDSRCLRRAELRYKDLDKWQTEQRVVEYPSLLEFLGYA